MSVNRQVPHVLVLPEDDANRQLANGFQLHYSVATRRMQVLEEAGGWREVLNRFKSDHVAEMDRNEHRFMVLLIDFDAHSERLAEVNAAIPTRLKKRVFVLGSWTKPEELRRALGSYETIGGSLAKDCEENTDVIWTHNLLRHNRDELARLRESVLPFLFSARID